MIKLFLRTLFLFVLSTTFLSAQSIRYADLSYDDVTIKSTELVRQHASFYEIDDTLAQRILERFLFELDPIKVFLLKSEVEPWTTPSKGMLKEIQHEFAQGSFPEFEKIFDLRAMGLERHKTLELLAKQLPAPVPLDSEKIKEFDWAPDTAALTLRLRTIQDIEKRAIARFEPKEQKKILERFEKRKKMLLSRESCQNKEEREKVISTILLKAFASALDAHTTYFTPAEANLFVSDVQQRIFGIGVLFRDDIDGFTILEIVGGGPASQQGQLKVDDKVIAVDGEPIIGNDLIEVVNKIRGKENTPVTLKVTREVPGQENETFDVTIIRGAVVVEESRLEAKALSTRNGVIGYVRLRSFYQDEKTSSSNDLRKKIIELKQKEKPIGLILDLRGNPGGILQQAVEICGLFLEPTLICSVKENFSIYPFWSLKTKKAWDGPLIVLTDRTSASASEIVAQTLQDWGRAIIVGDDRTFGKGSFQVLSFMADGTAVVDPKGEYKITHGRYYTTSGKSPQLLGVRPDIEVASPFRFMKIGEEFSTYPLSNETIPSYFDDPSLFKPVFQQEASLFSSLRQIFTNAFFGKTLQKKDDFLPISIHFLKKNSKNRLSQSKEYQEYVALLQKATEAEENIPDTKEDAKKETDFQLDETVEIMQEYVQKGRAA